MSRGWIGVDLDGTLAHYDGFKGAEVIGEPIIPMVERVSRWLDEGRQVRIFTARVWSDSSLVRDREALAARHAIERWCHVQFGTVLPITNVEDYHMDQLWDDRAVQVEKNTGRRMDGVPEGEPTP